MKHVARQVGNMRNCFQIRKRDKSLRALVSSQGRHALVAGCCCLSPDASLTSTMTIFTSVFFVYSLGRVAQQGLGYKTAD